jgi:hypothetical protein
MLEIDVFLGLDPMNPDTKVQPDVTSSHSGDDVIWHFHAIDDAIKYVRVEFAASDKFFDSRGGKSHQRKARLDKKPTGKGGHGHILGVTPSIGGGKTEAKKYVIRAFDDDPDSGGNEIAAYYLDPTIVTCDP